MQDSGKSTMFARKTASANQIAIMRHESKRLVLENHHTWTTEEETVEDTHYDLYTNN